MLNQIKNRILFPSLVLATSIFVPLMASAADVSDGAGFFSADTIVKADRAIHDLELKTGHQIRIETFATVPNGDAESVAKMSKDDRDTFFSKWEHEREEKTKSRGLYLLICKSPAHVQLWAGNPLQQAGFGAKQARSIRESLVADLKTHHYDKALEDTVAQIATTFDGLKPAHHSSTSSTTHPNPHHNAGPVVHHNAAPAPHQSGFSGLFWVMAIIIGGVLLFSMIARMIGGGGGYAPQQGYGPPGMGYGGGYGGGGGGFMRSLAGGIFGAMAGNWLYDQFSGGHQAHAGDSNWSNSDTPTDGPGGDNSDSGYSGGTDFGGDDFGDDSGGDSGGGSDFGGDDF